MIIDKRTLAAISTRNNKVLCKFLILEYLESWPGGMTKEAIFNFLESHTETDVKAGKGRVVYDYLNELIEVKLINTDTSTPVKYILTEHLRELEFIPVKKRNVPLLKSWEHSLRNYSHIPIFGELQQYIGDNKEKIAEWEEEHRGEEAFPTVSFDAPADYHEDDFLFDCYYAIYECTEISFRYTPFIGDPRGDEPVDVIDFRPYLLKEHKNRWYLVGKYKGGEEIETFSVGRISSIIDSEGSRFERDPFDPDHIWKHSMGIYTRWDKGERHENGNLIFYDTPIDISFRVKDGPRYQNIDYLKTSKIHASQELTLPGADGYATVKLHMFPDSDLVREIRKQGEKNVKDITPDFLSRWVMEDEE